MKQVLVVIAIVAAAGVGLVSWKLASDRRSVWTTSSPRTQGALTLVAVQPNPPRGWAGGTPHWNHANVEYQTAWFKIDRLPAPDQKALIQYWLVDQNRNATYLWMTYGEPASLPEVTHTAVGIPLSYGPEYVGATLEARSYGKTLGAWKLDRMPVLPKEIDDDEPDVLSAEAFGYRFVAEGFKARYTVRNGEKTSWYHYSPVRIEPTGADDGKDRLEVLATTPRTSYGRHSGSLSTTDPRTMRLLTAGSELSFTSSARRAEVTLQVRRYRTLDEPIVFRNVRAAVYNRSKNGKHITFRAEIDGPQTATTPSGLRFTLPVSDGPGYIQDDCLCFRLVCDQGSTDLELPNSPLYEATGKPVSIEFAYPDGKPLYCMTGMGEQEGEWTAPYKLTGPRRTQPFTIPELKLLVRQKVILEEKTVKLLAPVVPEAFVPRKESAKAGKRRPS